MDKLTKEQRSKNMQAIKNKGTKDEVLLAKKLWHIGLRYRKNDNSERGCSHFMLFLFIPRTDSRDRPL